MPQLKIARYRARFSGARQPQFGEFPGSAWRGALGHALRRAVCVMPGHGCRTCPLYPSCLYPHFYDTPPPPGATKMRRYETGPHPFVLEPGEAAGTEYQLDFVLIGNANRHLSVFLYALARAASSRRGVSGNQLTLLRVEQEYPPGSGTWHTILCNGQMFTTFPAAAPATPPVPPSCHIELITPLRVKRDGHHVGPREFRFADLFGSLLRRISMLTAFHTDTPLETDFRGLMQAARNTEAQCELVWRDMPRYSNRQKTSMKLGGVVGHLTLAAAEPGLFWPYLWLGRFVHAGSGATMGLGRYDVYPASLQGHDTSPEWVIMRGSH